MITSVQIEKNHIFLQLFHHDWKIKLKIKISFNYFLNKSKSNKVFRNNFLLSSLKLKKENDKLPVNIQLSIVRQIIIDH